MKTGDIVTDSRAQAWTLSALLGEGVWARTWLVKDDSGRQRVLKTPYEPEDLPPAAADKVALMRKSAIEQADLLASESPGLVPLEDRITLPTGATALLLPWYPTTLQRQLGSGIPLTEALHILLSVARALGRSPRNHGNLRPSNILIDPHGEPVVMDLATPSSQSLMTAHDRNQPTRKAWAPSDRIAPDTWAICQVLHAATLLEEAEQDGPTSLPTAGHGGLDKIALATLKDRAVARLKRDGANQRFVLRTAERLAAILARGLSRDADPSPPYRFLKAADLATRLSEVVALTDPGIESVGKLILSAAADGEIFSGSAAVGFTVSVAPTDGVKDATDIVCGVRLTDLDAAGDGRVPLDEAQFTVDRHPSGRFRFEFNLPEIAPGRYSVRVAFTVKESGQDPVVAEGGFEVRPPSGYVPPTPPDNGPAPISLASVRPVFDDDDDSEEEPPTVLMQRPSFSDFGLDDDDTGAEIVDAFPRPLAPTSPGTLIEEEEPPPPARPAPILAAVPTPPPTEPSLPGTDPGQSVPVPAVAQPQPSVTVAGPPPPPPPAPPPPAPPPPAPPRPPPLRQRPCPPLPSPVPGKPPSREKPTSSPTRPSPARATGGCWEKTLPHQAR